MRIAGDDDSFVSLFILSGGVEDSFFLPPRGAFMLDVRVFTYRIPSL